MFRLSFKETINEKIKAKCDRHPKYNPVTDGKQGIRDRCAGCYAMWDLLRSSQELEEAIREFRKKASAWNHLRFSRAKSAATPKRLES